MNEQSLNGLAALKQLFALLGDGRTKHGKRMRAYLDGTDDLDDLPTSKKIMDNIIKNMEEEVNDETTK